MAESLKILMEVFYRSQIYTFGGNTYRQKVGGPMGPRATCAISCVTMNMYDRIYKASLSRLKLSFELYIIFLDDLRLIF